MITPDLRQAFDKACALLGEGIVREHFQADEIARLTVEVQRLTAENEALRSGRSERGPEEPGEGANSD